MCFPQKGTVMKNTVLKDKREKRGLTQVQIAEKASISEVSYQRIEQGFPAPGVQTASLIADTLRVKFYKQFKALWGDQTEN